MYVLFACYIICIFWYFRKKLVTFFFIVLSEVVEVYYLKSDI